MPDKVFLLRKTGGIYALGDDAVHYAGVPYRGPDKDNLNCARTFKKEVHAKNSNEFKFWGYEVVPAEISINIKITE